MASSTATAPQFFNLTHSLPPSSKFLHFTNVPSSLQHPFPSGIFYKHRSHQLLICDCNSKLNNSSGGEQYELDEGLFGGYDGVDDESDEDDAESSLDLFIRFFQSMFRKFSKRAKKASRSVLPSVISPQLVGPKENMREKPFKGFFCSGWDSATCFTFHSQSTS
ncbi:protein SHORT HYPOCOTYL IN WHITE LIGHT 1 isoform X2 [Arachis ipaensis]|uniref:protein SHORT HYPOCOTYL IN WHITE LIGHT 1 isoform X2 n=1 Tax=Arachis ipaensis TaxID=130454 RepID=UPI0007AF67C9|nr:protein SHORT HYPOCOTYL IN WHITE LIGHT 1 isoform X2 [Arachis ipaensis]